MEGSDYRKKREQIEDVFNDVAQLLDNKDAEAAQEKIDEAMNLMSELSNMQLSEIQKRSFFNLKVKGDHLQARFLKK